MSNAKSAPLLGVVEMTVNVIIIVKSSIGRVRDSSLNVLRVREREGGREGDFDTLMVYCCRQ